MSANPNPRLKRLRQLLQDLSQINLNDIDFKNAGSWPRSGRISVWLLTALGTLIAGYLFYLSPLLQQLQQAERQEQELLSHYEIKAYQSANLAAYQQQMQQIQQQIRQLDQQLPRRKAVPELIEQIGLQAQQHKVDIRGLKLQPEGHESAYDTQPISLTVQGRYHDIARFMAGLSQTQRIITLHDFTLESGDRQLQLKLEAIAYHNTADEHQRGDHD